MRLVAGVVAAQLCGCSFMMNTAPSTMAVEQEPSCSESYSAPTFDATIAVGMVIAAAIAAVTYSKYQHCGGLDARYGFPTEPSCYYYDVDIGGGLAAGALFGYAAYRGHASADRCRKLNDAHDHWLAQQHTPLIGQTAEMRNQCLTERAKIAAQLHDPREIAQLSDNMPCEQPAPHRTKPRHSEDGVGAGLILGVTVAFTLDAILANTTK